MRAEKRTENRNSSDQKSGEQTNTEKTRRILIVDDDPSIARALFAILSPYNQCKIVDSGNKAIDALKKSEFDLILTDCEMEQGSGLDLLEYISDQNIKTPAIMITAFGTKELVLKTLRYNVFGFIEKPFNPSMVEELAKKAFKIKDESDRMQTLAVLGVNLGEIVHEISSPLTVLDISVGNLSRESTTLNSERLKKSVDKIKDIVANTKSEIRGKTKQGMSLVNIADVIKESEVETTPRAKKNGVAVQFEGDFNVQLQGNATRLRQIIVNLVNNGIDAAAATEQKWVKVSMSRLSNSPGNSPSEEQQIQISVKDSGLGISKEIRKRLFEPLFTTKGENGTGLGLGIVRKLANEHGGTVHLDTDSKNTEFLLVLPLK